MPVSLSHDDIVLPISPGVVNLLPTEVLEIIFDEVFELYDYDIDDSFADTFDQINIRAPMKRVVEPERLKQTIDMSRFPYCISRVCSRWNEICLRFPWFWTRIAIDIGPQASSVLQLRRELEASKGSQIDVLISRRDGFKSQDDLEHYRLDAFLSVLVDHVNRCITLQVRTMHRSSLLSVNKHLNCWGAALKHFEIQSHSIDISRIAIGVVHQQFSSLKGKIFLPNIDTVVLDALLFNQYLKQHWITHTPSGFKNLTVIGLDSSDLDSQAVLPVDDTFRALRVISRLSTISFKGVRFDEDEIRQLYASRNDGGYRHGLPQGLKYIHLEDLQQHAAPILLRFFARGYTSRTLETLVIKDCPVTSIDPRSMPFTQHLSLLNIGADEDLMPVLRGSNPCVLSVSACPSFTSSTMEQLSKPAKAGRPPYRWICARLQELEIRLEIGGGEPSFNDRITVTAIKDFVASRQYGYSTEWREPIVDHVVSRVDRLWLYGFKNSIKDVENVEWLRRNLIHFDMPM